MDNIIIRTAVIDDAAEILKIYKYYILNTAISFEYTIPSLEEFKNRIKKTLESYPYLVACINNEILGYAYAGALGSREAYKYSVELSVYVNKEYKKQGIGKLLYTHLETTLKAMGITNLYANVAIPTKPKDEYLDFNSLNFHKHLGFKQIGEYHKCGYKFNHWYSIVSLEKIIIQH